MEEILAPGGVGQLVVSGKREAGEVHLLELPLGADDIAGREGRGLKAGQVHRHREVLASVTDPLRPRRGDEYKAAAAPKARKSRRGGIASRR